MAVTAQQVYDMALVLMDEVTEAGSIATEEADAVKTKAKNILTQLQAELLPISQTPGVITDLSQNLSVTDREALLILPYGLAAHLLLNEQNSATSYYNDRYEELKRKRKTSITAVTDVYCVTQGMV
jgi:hypothetical protein